MKINEKDISLWCARQWNVDIGHNEVKNDSEWVRGSPIPAFFHNTIGFKDIKITLLVKGNSRSEIEKRRSDIVSNLIQPAVLSLDGFEHKFQVIFNKSSVTESSITRFHQLILEFKGFEFGDEITLQYKGIDAFTIMNPGNLITPLIIQITPQVGASSITCNGLCRNLETGEIQIITIKELTTGKNILLDGESGLMTEDGQNKFKDIELWELPTLMPGENEVTFSTKNIEVVIKFRPRFI